MRAILKGNQHHDYDGDQDPEKTRSKEEEEAEGIFTLMGTHENSYKNEASNSWNPREKGSASQVNLLSAYPFNNTSPYAVSHCKTCLRAKPSPKQQAISH